LTVPYQELSRELSPLTTTLPITLLNLPRIVAIFSEFYSSFKGGRDYVDSGLDSALHLHQALYETCLGEALSQLPETTEHLLLIGSLRALDPKLVERTYSTLSQILRIIASPLLKPEAKDVLEQTWARVRPYLRPKQNKRYIRKCVADAWVGVIRKARGDGLARLLDVLLGEESEGMEAVWAESLKGIGNTLHSRAVPIFNFLLDRMAESPTPSQVATLNLVTLALVHHCSSTTLAPIVEAITFHIDTSAAGLSAGAIMPDLASSTAYLSLLSTTLLTRKGKRFAEVLLKSTMSKLLALVPRLHHIAGASDEVSAAAWRQQVVQAVVGCLIAGRLAHWLSPGVSLIEVLWNELVTAIRLASQCRY
jgi:U3 small nucleolar RNA-associated protein 20